MRHIPSPRGTARQTGAPRRRNGTPCRRADPYGKKPNSSPQCMARGLESPPRSPPAPSPPSGLLDLRRIGSGSCRHAGPAEEGAGSPDDQGTQSPRRHAENNPDGPEAPSLFWSGEALLRTRALLILGSDARDALGLPRIGPYCQTMVRGRLFIQLPQPRSLAEKPEAFGQAMAFLAGLLRFCSTARH